MMLLLPMIWGCPLHAQEWLSHDPISNLPRGAHQIQMGINLGEDFSGQGITGISVDYTYSILLWKKLYAGLTTGLQQPDPINRYIIIPTAADVKWIPFTEQKHPWMIGVTSGYTWILYSGDSFSGRERSGGLRYQYYVGRMFSTKGKTHILVDVGLFKQKLKSVIDNSDFSRTLYRKTDFLTLNRFQVRFGVLF